jgi:hypothetical protein
MIKAGKCLWRGPRAPDNPWGAGTLEWATTSPPEARDMQTNWGLAVYRLEFARCHDPGRSAPQMNTQNLMGHGNARNLYEFNRSTMPLDKPGTLPDAYYGDVTAYLLAAEGLLALPSHLILDQSTADEVHFLPALP